MKPRTRSGGKTERNKVMFDRGDLLYAERCRRLFPDKSYCARSYTRAACPECWCVQKYSSKARKWTGGNLTAWLRLAVALGHEKDILSVLSKPKVTTIEDHQKLGQGKFEGRLRVRGRKGQNNDA